MYFFRFGKGGFKMARDLISSFIYGIFASWIVVLLASLLLRNIGVAPLKYGGTGLIILLVLVFLTFVWQAAREGGWDKNKIIALVLVIAILIATIIYFPKFLPEFFSTVDYSPIKQQIFSIFGR